MQDLAQDQTDGRDQMLLPFFSADQGQLTSFLVLMELL